MKKLFVITFLCVLAQLAYAQDVEPSKLWLKTAKEVISTSDAFEFTSAHATSGKINPANVDNKLWRDVIFDRPVFSEFRTLSGNFEIIDLDGNPKTFSDTTLVVSVSDLSVAWPPAASNLVGDERYFVPVYEMGTLNIVKRYTNVQDATAAAKAAPAPAGQTMGADTASIRWIEPGQSFIATMDGHDYLYQKKDSTWVTEDPNAPKVLSMGKTGLFGLGREEFVLVTKDSQGVWGPSASNVANAYRKGMGPWAGFSNNYGTGRNGAPLGSYGYGLPLAAGYYPNLYPPMYGGGGWGGGWSTGWNAGFGISFGFGYGLGGGGCCSPYGNYGVADTWRVWTIDQCSGYGYHQNIDPYYAGEGYVKSAPMASQMPPVPMNSTRMASEEDFSLTADATPVATKERGTSGDVSTRSMQIPSSHGAEAATRSESVRPSGTQADRSSIRVPSTVRPEVVEQAKPTRTAPERSDRVNGTASSANRGDRGAATQQRTPVRTNDRAAAQQHQPQRGVPQRQVNNGGSRIPDSGFTRAPQQRQPSAAPQRTQVQQRQPARTQSQTRPVRGGAPGGGRGAVPQARAQQVRR